MFYVCSNTKKCPLTVTEIRTNDFVTLINDTVFQDLHLLQLVYSGLPSLYCSCGTDFTHSFGVSMVNLEQVNVS